MFNPGIVFKILIIIILILALKLLLFNISKPFWGHHDWNSVVYSNVARNYIRYGYLATKFGQVTNVDVQSPNSFSYITHYPPALPILMSFSFRILGQTESSARLAILFFSLILVYFIYQLGKELYSAFLGIFAALSLILTPIFLYFGKLPVHDTVVPAISTLGFWLFIKYIKEKKDTYYVLLLISLIFGGFVNWSAFYLVVALVFISLASGEKFNRKKIIALIPVSILIFFVQVLHIKLLGVSSESVISNVLIRANPYLSADLYGFTLLKYIKQELLLIKSYYSLLILIGGTLFFILCVKSIMQKKLSFNQILILGMFLYGAMQLVVFSQLSFIHDYMIYYLSPFLILSFSYVTFIIFKKFKKTVIFPVILILLISFNFLSGLKFTNALLETAMHKRGYEAAKIINSKINSGEKAFVGSNSYKEFEDVFIGYYADREVEYGEVLPENFMTTFKLIIRPKDHDALNFESKQLLDEQLKKYEDGNFMWYKI